MLQGTILFEGLAETASICGRKQLEPLIVGVPDFLAAIQLRAAEGKANFFQLGTSFLGQRLADRPLIC